MQPIAQITLEQPSLEQITLEQITLEQRLRNAISQELLTLDFQPIHSSNGDLIAFEALCRWTDDRFGMISPDQFIPLAEKLGLMESLGAWVLTEACKQGAWLQSAIQEIPISVNVASSQLLQPDFVELVYRALTSAGLPASTLRLEINEHTLIDLETCLAHLYDLRALGVQIAMDDFGQGNSNVAKMAVLPLHVLKLDRCFVKDIQQEPRTQALVEGIVQLAHRLGYQVIAKGVETLAQQQTLEALGCDALQGFLFSKAIPIFDAMAYLAERQFLPDQA
jgi:EAL domain-containing protein (putative c-di-GMP-specific phosphodiesterase class I)